MSEDARTKERKEIEKLVDNYNRTDDIGKIMIATYLSALVDRASMEKVGQEVRGNENAQKDSQGVNPY